MVFDFQGKRTLGDPLATPLVPLVESTGLGVPKSGGRGRGRVGGGRSPRNGKPVKTEVRTSTKCEEVGKKPGKTSPLNPVDRQLALLTEALMADG